jgi:hypothetical protein
VYVVPQSPYVLYWDHHGYTSFLPSFHPSFLLITQALDVSTLFEPHWLSKKGGRSLGYLLDTTMATVPSA